MVHRGWQHTSHSSDIKGGSQRRTSKKLAPSSPQAQSPAAVQRRLVSNVEQDFAFVNVTDPDKSRDPEMRKLVRGHVVKDSTRKKRLQRQLNAEHSKGSGFGSTALDKKISTGAGAGLSATDSSSQVSTLPDPPRRSSLSFALHPTQGLDPHPQLSPKIYHLTLMGDAMYPLVSRFRFNPVSPAAWFDSALQDSALFHALLHTSSTYLALIRGLSENREAIVHGGKSIKLVKNRLDGMISGAVTRHGNMEVVEMTLRAISCLAISEVCVLFPSYERLWKCS